jgi:hypothetical protein
MDSISNVDRIIQVLRQRLAERARNDRAKPAARKPAQQQASIDPLAAVKDLDERQFRRALIQRLLADQFGAGVLNDPKFQQVVDRVTTMIEDDPKFSQLLQTVSSELRASA